MVAGKPLNNVAFTKYNIYLMAKGKANHKQLQLLTKMNENEGMSKLKGESPQ